MVCTADKNKTCNTAEGTGNDEGSDDNLRNIDADISCCVLAFTNNRDFVALLCLFKIDINHSCENCHCDDVEKIGHIKKNGKSELRHVC